MEKKELLYEGKGKKLFATENPEILISEFKDDLTAFNAQKKGSESGKGALNCKISKILFELLEKNGIETHMVSVLSDNEMEVKKVSIIPIEVVARNIATGSLSKRLGIENGKKLPFTLVEFYYKDDSLGDPIINDEHALMMELASKGDLEVLKEKARKVNEALFKFFDEKGLILVDFKLEFGKDVNGKILLADEISPDSCRLWDKETLEKLDKDRFREDLGSVKAGYEKVLEKILA